MNVIAHDAELDNPRSVPLCDLGQYATQERGGFDVDEGESS
jgi:hypothetical protein